MANTATKAQGEGRLGASGAALFGRENKPCAPFFPFHPRPNRSARASANLHGHCTQDNCQKSISEKTIAKKVYLSVFGHFGKTLIA